MKTVIMTMALGLLAVSVPWTSTYAQNDTLSMEDVMNQAVTKHSKNPPAGNNTGITVNKSRQQMQQGYGNAGCVWDGGHDMLGVPGAEVPVVCKCNGQVVADNNCSGPKPGNNHYYGQ